VVTSGNHEKQIKADKESKRYNPAVGITRPYLSDIERGVKTPGGDIIIRIANYLKLPVEEIFLRLL